MEGCLACDLATGRHELPRGLIHETRGWLVEQPATRVQLATHDVYGPALQVAIFDLGDEPPRERVEAFAERAPLFAA